MVKFFKKFFSSNLLLFFWLLIILIFILYPFNTFSNLDNPQSVLFFFIVFSLVFLWGVIINFPLISTYHYLKKFGKNNQDGKQLSLKLFPKFLLICNGIIFLIYLFLIFTFLDYKINITGYSIISSMTKNDINGMGRGILSIVALYMNIIQIILCSTYLELYPYLTKKLKKRNIISKKEIKPLNYMVYGFAILLVIKFLIFLFCTGFIKFHHFL